MLIRRISLNQDKIELQGQLIDALQKFLRYSNVSGLKSKANIWKLIWKICQRICVISIAAL